MSSIASVTDAGILNSYIGAQEAGAKAASAAAEAAKGKSLWGDFNTFLTVLTTQLQNQDPTTPVDVSEFTSQLVQYAEVEQQISTNDKLDDIKSIVGSNGLTPLLNYIGQYVETKASDGLVVQGGVGMMAYALDAQALSATLSVQDSKGDVIATVTGPTDKGVNRIAWDGKLDDGTKAADGVYKFVLTVKDHAGNAIAVDDQRVIGQVSSLETNADGTVVLKAGSLEIPQEDILSIFAGVGVSDTGSPAS